MKNSLFADLSNTHNAATVFVFWGKVIADIVILVWLLGIWFHLLNERWFLSNTHDAASIFVLWGEMITDIIVLIWLLSIWFHLRKTDGISDSKKS